MLRHGFIAALAIAAMSGLGAPSMASAGSRVVAPVGFQILCLRSPRECRGGGAAIMKLTSSAMSKIKRVNPAVNRRIRPKADPRGLDIWSVNVSAGDCEDYALTKRHALIAAGLPASSLRIAYVKTRRNENHAVLIVKTTRGNFVLDNLTNKILPLSQSGLRLISISGANPRNWS